MTTLDYEETPREAGARLARYVFIALIVVTLLWGGNIHTYGHPGSPNGGIVAYGFGVELWGQPGFFKENK